MKRQFSSPVSTNVAVMGEAIEESGGNLGVAEDRRPFAEVEVYRHDNGNLLIELADQMEQGPAVIEEYEGTTAVPPDATMFRDRFDNIVIEFAEAVTA